MTNEQHQSVILSDDDFDARRNELQSSLTSAIAIFSSKHGRSIELTPDLQGKTYDLAMTVLTEKLDTFPAYSEA